MRRLLGLHLAVLAALSILTFGLPALSDTLPLLGVGSGLGCVPVSPPSGGIYDSTNLSGWSVSGGAFTLNNAASPDCATNGSTFVEDTSGTVHEVSTTISHTFSAQSTTFTFYEQRVVGTRNSQFAFFDQTFAHDTVVIVNPATCSAAAAVTTTFPGATASTTFTVVGSWCKVTVTTTLVTATSLIPALANVIGSSGANYTGDGVSSLAYWGMGLTTP